MVPKATHPKYPKAASIHNAIVWVTVFRALPVDGIKSAKEEGYGLIINKDLGLVLLSRDVVRSEFCTSTITIFGSLVIPAQIVFVHPVMNFAVMRYDPSLVEAPLESARLSDVEIEVGDSALLYIVNDSWLLNLSPAFVSGKNVVSISPDMRNATRAVNIEVLSVSTPSASGYTGTGLVSEDGEVKAMWFGSYCTAIAPIIPILQQIERGESPETRLLGARLHAIDLADVATMAVPEGNSTSV
jgi:hypothetical protein